MYAKHDYSHIGMARQVAVAMDEMLIRYVVSSIKWQYYLPQVLSQVDNYGMTSETLNVTKKKPLDIDTFGEDHVGARLPK